MNIKKIVDAISNISSDTDVPRCASYIATQVKEISLSNSCQVYIFDRLTSSYKLCGNSGNSNQLLLFDKEIAIEEIDERITAYRPERAYRGNFMCGFCVFDNANYSDKDFSLNALSSLISILYNRLFSVSIFTEMHEPIKFNQSAHSYRKSLLDISRRCSQAPFSMHFVKHEGVWVQKYFWNNYSVNSICSVKNEIITDNKSLNYLNGLKEHTYLLFDKYDIDQVPFLHSSKMVGLFSGVICTSKLGGDGLVVIVYGFPMKYFFSSLELNGYLSLTNAISISASNYLNAQKDKDEHALEQKMDELSGTLELIRRVRHDLAAYLDAISTKVITQKNRLKKSKKNIDIQSIVEEMESLQSVIDQSKVSADSIKSLLYEPKLNVENVSLEDFKEMILDNFGGKGEYNGVSLSINEMKHIVYADKARLRQIFNNLILNSIEAYKDNKHRLSNSLKKEIKVYISDSKSKDTITIRYVDNAGGIIKSEIINAGKKANCSSDDVYKLVFEKRVTTKTKGSGNGMHISRALASKFNGQLSLVSYTDGRIIFDLKIPRGE